MPLRPPPGPWGGIRPRQEASLALLPKGGRAEGLLEPPGIRELAPAKKLFRCAHSLLQRINQRFNISKIEAFLPGSKMRFRNPWAEPELVWEAHKSRKTNKSFRGGLCKVPQGAWGIC